MQGNLAFFDSLLVLIETHIHACQLIVPLDKIRLGLRSSQRVLHCLIEFGASGLGSLGHNQLGQQKAKKWIVRVSLQLLAHPCESLFRVVSLKDREVAGISGNALCSFELFRHFEVGFRFIKLSELLK